jgi:ATP-dependent DNA helicase RecQ
MEQAGIPAAFLNISLSQEEYRDVMAGTRAGAYKILYVAPERLLTESFLALTRSLKVAMVTVDEAALYLAMGPGFPPELSADRAVSSGSRSDRW